MNHNLSVFANSCLKVPVDPVSKMPKSAYERKKKHCLEQCSIDSVSSINSRAPVDLDVDKVKEFYRSIPDYNEINHLPADEFYITLNILKEKKRVVLGYNDLDHYDVISNKHTSYDKKLPDLHNDLKITRLSKHNLKNLDLKVRRKSGAENNELDKSENLTPSVMRTTTSSHIARRADGISKSIYRENSKSSASRKASTLEHIILPKKDMKPKRNHSACSISWNDLQKGFKDEVDEKFEQYFDGKNYGGNTVIEDDFRTRSMPSSPLRSKKIDLRRKSITVPKPFKMTERHEDERIVNELRSIRKSFSDDMIHRKQNRKQFRARPVPIESRIPLYDKILEDQAMRRAITKINSEAELRAQMKPFSFTKREEKGLPAGVCEKAAQALPKPKKKKRFRARPVPKNLFSNYFYEKRKEDDFFRSMNRRIRAEEMLRTASLPGSMAARDRSHLSTPAAHSDLPIDPSSVAPSASSFYKQRSSSPTKTNKRRSRSCQEFITTSTQPFHLTTADRAAKKMAEITKIYEDNKMIPSIGGSTNAPVNRVYSALDLKAHGSGRSNLAALLRAEAVRSKFEMESVRRYVEQRRRAEHRARDRVLRSNPAWHMVKNNHEEDIAMRLQTRRDEERMRREEFLHEMELMYGRVQQQPMLFERYYAPRSHHSSMIDSFQLSPRKGGKSRSGKFNKSYQCSPTRLRKVSINEDKGFNEDLAEYISRIENERSYSDSESFTARK